MKIGIIGAGHIGGNLAQLLVRHGHQVVIANSRGPQTLDEVAARNDQQPIFAKARLGHRIQLTRARSRVCEACPLQNRFEGHDVAGRRPRTGE